jgi:hypothetical protein
LGLPKYIPQLKMKIGVVVNLFHDMRILPAAKWYKEIARMELDDLVGELLLDCLALDAST